MGVSPGAQGSALWPLSSGHPSPLPAGVGSMEGTREGSWARPEVAVPETETHLRDLAVPGCRGSWAAPSGPAASTVPGRARQPAGPAVLPSGFKVSLRKISPPGDGWSSGVWRERLPCLREEGMGALRPPAVPGHHVAGRAHPPARPLPAGPAGWDAHLRLGTAVWPRDFCGLGRWSRGLCLCHRH